MQYEPNFQVRGAEVVENLAFRCARKLRTGLRFDDHFVIHDHVDSLHCEYVILIGHVDADFSRNAMAAVDQLTLQRHHVHVLEEAEPKVLYTSKNAPMIERVSRSSIK